MKVHHTALALLLIAVSVAAQSCDLNTDDIDTHCKGSDDCFINAQDTDCCNVITQFQSDLLCHIPLFTKLAELNLGDGCAENISFDTVQGTICDADGDVANTAACNAAVDSVEEACRDSNECMTGDPSANCCAAMDAYSNAGCSNDDYPIAQGQSCTATTVEAFSSDCTDSQSCEGIAEAVEESCQDENNCMSDSPGQECCTIMEVYNTGSCDNLVVGTSGCNVTYTDGSAYSDNYCDAACGAQMLAVEEACLDSSDCASAEPSDECCAAMQAYTDVGGCSGSLDLGDGCTAVGDISTYSAACDLSPCNALLDSVQSQCVDSGCVSSPSEVCCAAMQAFNGGECDESEYSLDLESDCQFSSISEFHSDNCDDDSGGVEGCSGLASSIASSCVTGLPPCVDETPSDSCCEHVRDFVSDDCSTDLVTFPNNPLCDYTPDDVNDYASAKCPSSSSSASTLTFAASMLVAVVAAFFRL